MGDIATTRVQLNTTTGTQNITIAGFGTPDAAIIIAQNVSADDTATTGARISVGFTDGATDAFSFIQSIDNLASSSTDRIASSGQLGTVYDNTATVIQQFSFSSWITDGIQIDNTTAAGNTIFATVILLKNIQASAFIEQMLTTSETVTTGFEPDLVILGGVGNNATTIGINAIYSLGFAHNDGIDSNYGTLFFDRDGQSTTQVGSYISDTYSFGQYFNDALTWGGSVDTYTSTGFTLRASASPGNDYVVGLAIKFDNPANINLAIVDSPAATGAVNYDSAGFTPEFGMYLTTKNTAVDTVQTVGRDVLGVWTIDANSYQSNVYYSDDAAATTDTASLVSDSKLKDLDTSSTSLNEGTFTGFDTNGFDFNFTTVAATQRKWIELAITTASGGAINVTGATSSYSYSSQSAVIDLTGAINVTGSTSTYSYTAQPATIDLTSEIQITGATPTYSYNAIAGNVSLVNNEILITGDTPSYSYGAVSGTVLLQGTIAVTGTTPTYTYSAISARVQVGELDIPTNFDGYIKSIAFNGAVQQSQFSGTIKSLEFSGKINETNFIGVRK